MASKNIHSELENWKNLENLIEFYKFKIGHTFPLLYWSAGILFTIILGVMIAQSDKIIGFTGRGWWITLIILLTGALLISLSLINKVHIDSADNLEYLYRRLDGQLK